MDGGLDQRDAANLKKATRSGPSPAGDHADPWQTAIGTHQTPFPRQRGRTPRIRGPCV